MTAEHLRPLLECDCDVAVFHQFAHIMARGEVLDKIEEVMRLGRVTALRDPTVACETSSLVIFSADSSQEQFRNRLPNKFEVATAPW